MRKIIHRIAFLQAVCPLLMPKTSLGSILPRPFTFIRKTLLLVGSLCFFFNVSGQRTTKEFELANLPAVVQGEWKFHAGDQPAWADTAFDDHAWQFINPTRQYHFLPELARAEIGWFRLTLDVSPALRKKAVAIVIRQSGAADVYFNGSLIRTMGRVSKDARDERTRYSVAEPLILQLGDQPKQYIALRYSFNRSNLVIGYGQPVIRASFEKVDTAWDKFFLQIDYYTTRAWVSGGFMLLSILQLAIYLFDRRRKVNLYLSLYALMQMITLADGLFTPMFLSSNWIVFFNIVVFSIAAPLDFVFLMLMTYAYFGYKRGWWFMVTVVLALPVTIAQFIGDNAQNESLLAIYNMLNYLTIIGISSKAIREKKPGAKLFLAGIIVALIFFVLFNLSGDILKQPFLMECFEVALAFITPAVVLSILLAREFALNLVSLRNKLAEVEILSARTLEQEVEKQSILSRQNELLEQKVSERTSALNQSLTELKATQTQLIQSEKMASLGELTAGIAHEIQNPLNFVNNFSEVSSELVQEMDAELDKGDITEARAIGADLKENLEKIRHHGKRAEGIVKGMLEHSRTSTGQKELTDLNALADEYLRLSYHGFRTKEKTFNADLITYFDKDAPLINLVPQDIGRVLLNLFNNAFYAVNQKHKDEGQNYKPAVVVTTLFANQQIFLKVNDNGKGISTAIKDKIMQPFFTTKPTGEGTGLGLSLSYDIVVKGHAGKIDLESTDGEGATFTIILPA